MIRHIARVADIMFRYAARKGNHGCSGYMPHHRQSAKTLGRVLPRGSCWHGAFGWEAMPFVVLHDAVDVIGLARGWRGRGFGGIAEDAVADAFVLVRIESQPCKDLMAFR